MPMTKKKGGEEEIKMITRKASDSAEIYFIKAKNILRMILSFLRLFFCGFDFSAVSST